MKGLLLCMVLFLIFQKKSTARITRIIAAISYVILNVVLKFKYSTKGVFTAPAYIQTGTKVNRKISFLSYILLGRRYT